MKRIAKESLKMSRAELESALGGELKNLNKLEVAVCLGREKKTHLLGDSRRKIALIKTVLAQKSFLEAKV